MHRSSRPKVFFKKVVLKICSKFWGEHPSQSVISIKLQLRDGCSPVNFLHIFKTLFLRTPLDGCFYMYFILFTIRIINKHISTFLLHQIIYTPLKNSIKPFFVLFLSRIVLSSMVASSMKLSSTYSLQWEKSRKSSTDSSTSASTSRNCFASCLFLV